MKISENCLYTDIVVTKDGQPIKSFSCEVSVTDSIELAKHFVLEEKMASLRNGDRMGEYVVHRNAVDMAFNPPKAALDKDFEASVNGLKATNHEAMA